MNRDDNSPLMQLYYGRRGNPESIPVDEKYLKLLDNLVDYEKEILNRLEPTPELKDLFTKFADTTMAMSASSSSAHYIEGLSFGSLLGLDIAKSL